MGEYECWNCDEKFHLDEPPYDGREICYQCREEEKNEKGWTYKKEIESGI